MEKETREMEREKEKGIENRLKELEIKEEQLEKKMTRIIQLEEKEEEREEKEGTISL